MLRVSSSRWPSKKCSVPATTICCEPAILRICANRSSPPKRVTDQSLLPNTSSTGTLMRNMSSRPLMMLIITHASTSGAFV